MTCILSYFTQIYTHCIHLKRTEPIVISLQNNHFDYILVQTLYQTKMYTSWLKSFPKSRTLVHVIPYVQNLHQRHEYQPCYSHYLNHALDSLLLLHLLYLPTRGLTLQKTRIFPLSSCIVLCSFLRVVSSSISCLSISFDKVSCSNSSSVNLLISFSLCSKILPVLYPKGVNAPLFSSKAFIMLTSSFILNVLKSASTSE